MLNDVTVINIRECISDGNDEGLGEGELLEILSEFSCEKNPDVERFLKNSSIEFAKKNQSVTYLVFLKEDASLVGYFTLAIKTIRVNADVFSKNLNKKIGRVSDLDKESNTYTLSAYLIAQLGKNYTNNANEKIEGRQLLQAAIDTIKKLQYMAGGTVCFLEAEDKQKLLEFYENENSFKRFSTRESKNDRHKLVQLLKVI